MCIYHTLVKWSQPFIERYVPSISIRLEIVLQRRFDRFDSVYNILIHYRLPVRKMGVHNRIPFCICPWAAQYIIKHVLCNPGGIQKWCKCFHLQVWGCGISYKWECYTSLLNRQHEFPNPTSTDLSKY